MSSLIPPSSKSSSSHGSQESLSSASIPGLKNKSAKNVAQKTQAVADSSSSDEEISRSESSLKERDIEPHKAHHALVLQKASLLHPKEPMVTKAFEARKGQLDNSDLIADLMETNDGRKTIATFTHNQGNPQNFEFLDEVRLLNGKLEDYNKEKAKSKPDKKKLEKILADIKEKYNTILQKYLDNQDETRANLNIQPLELSDKFMKQLFTPTDNPEVLLARLNVLKRQVERQIVMSDFTKSEECDILREKYKIPASQPFVQNPAMRVTSENILNLVKTPEGYQALLKWSKKYYSSENVKFLGSYIKLEQFVQEQATHLKAAYEKYSALKTQRPPADPQLLESAEADLNMMTELIRLQAGPVIDDYIIVGESEQEKIQINLPYHLFELFREPFRSGFHTFVGEGGNGLKGLEDMFQPFQEAATEIAQLINVQTPKFQDSQEFRELMGIKS